jgi:hypothetical protein
LESNIKAIGATSSSTLGFENQGEQHVVTTKPTSPIRVGLIYNLYLFFFLVMIIVVLIVVITEPIVTPSLVINNRIEPLELPLTPPQINIGSKITLIYSTLHALKIFVTLTTTFIDTHVQLMFTTKTSTQFMGSVEDVEEIGIKLVEDITK